MDQSRAGPPLDTRPLFPAERAEFTALLWNLDPGGWQRPTVCPGWRVHDVVAHVVHSDRLTWPVVDTFLRAVPYALRHLSPGPGTCLHIQVTGPGGGSWTVRRQDATWVVNRGWPDRRADAIIRLSSDALWWVATRGIPVETARAGRADHRPGAWRVHHHAPGHHLRATRHGAGVARRLPSRHASCVIRCRPGPAAPASRPCSRSRPGRCRCPHALLPARGSSRRPR